MARVPGKLTIQFSPASANDLADIWRWNAENRGERQADGYVNFLRMETRKLARFTTPGRVVPSNQTLRYHTIKRRSGAYGHVVVFWIDGETLNVLRYFHTSQDWEKNVEDLPGAGT